MSLYQKIKSAIDLTAKLFDLNPRQAAEKLAHNFGLDPDKPPANAIALPPPKRGLTDEQWVDIAFRLGVVAYRQCNTEKPRNFPFALYKHS